MDRRDESGLARDFLNSLAGMLSKWGEKNALILMMTGWQWETARLLVVAAKIDAVQNDKCQGLVFVVNRELRIGVEAAVAGERPDRALGASYSLETLASAVTDRNPGQS